MTDEEKKEYRDKLVEDCMKYNHIDYDDDKDIVETMVEAIASEELMELIPNFDPYNLTARQRLLVYSFVKELYDHREKYQNGTQQLTNAVSTMLLNISIHAPTRGATTSTYACADTLKFQSTLPHGERR